MTNQDPLRWRVEELWKLGGDMSKADIIRHFKEIERETAKACTEMIKDEVESMAFAEFFEGPITLKKAGRE